MKVHLSEQSTFAGNNQNNAMLPSEITDFAMLPTLRDFWQETLLLLDGM